MGTDMTKGRPLPVLLRFTIPLLLGNLFQQFYNMADTIIVGRYMGAGALAAVGSTGIIMFLITGFAQGLTSGFTILTAQRYGAGDTAGVKRSVSAGIFLSAVTTVILTGFFLAVMDPLLRLMQTPEDIFREAGRYIRIVAAGTAACVFYNLFSAFLRAVGNSRVPLFFLVFSACLNVALDLALIVGGGMGVEGAALATVLSQAVSAVLCGGYIFLKTPDLTPGAGQWRPHRGDVRRELWRLLPLFNPSVTPPGSMALPLRAVLFVLGMIFTSMAVAAYTAAGKLETLVEQGMIALGQAMASYAGQNFGKGDLDRVKKGVRAGMTVTVVYAVMAAVLGTVFLRPAMSLFFTGDISAVMPWARTYMNICVVFFVPLGAIFVYRNVMQGCGYGFLPMAGGIAELLARLVTAVLAMKMGSYVLTCFCHPAAWTAAAVFLWVSYERVIRKAEREKKAEDPPAAF